MSVNEGWISKFIRLGVVSVVVCINSECGVQCTRISCDGEAPGSIFCIEKHSPGCDPLFQPLPTVQARQGWRAHLARLDDGSTGGSSL